MRTLLQTVALLVVIGTATVAGAQEIKLQFSEVSGLSTELTPIEYI